MDAQHEITEQLVTLRRNEDPAAWDRLVPLVYSELRAIAHRQLRRERENHTLNTTALVNEAYLRLVNQRRVDWHDRAHFFAMAATVMRRVLIDYARRPRTGKTVSIDSSTDLLADERADALVALDDALTRLALLDQRLVRVVECRFFGGLTEEETATALGITARTVRRDWVKAKGWLLHELAE
jgi:RNA polymerase sigma factor (TIGR02999 family)